MKTFYFIKTLVPFIFLPVAPGVLQMELVRQGALNSNSGLMYAVIMQILFTFGIVAWLLRVVRRRDDKSFLRMSCISKKVFHLGKWMSVEQYLADHHNIVVSHGMTPEETTAWAHDAEEYLRSEELKPVEEIAVAA